MIFVHRLGWPMPVTQSPGRLLLLAACIVSLLAACTSTNGRAHLPAKAPAAVTASASTSPRLPRRQQVIAAYVGYATAMAAAFASRSPAMVRQLLGPYLDAATIRNAIAAFNRAWANGEVSYGRVARHIIGVRIHGAAAWVHDCDDASNSGLAYASTGQPVPGTLGTPDEDIVTRLNLVRGHWMVAVQTVEDLACKP